MVDGCIFSISLVLFNTKFRGILLLADCFYFGITRIYGKFVLWHGGAACQFIPEQMKAIIVFAPYIHIETAIAWIVVYERRIFVYIYSISIAWKEKENFNVIRLMSVWFFSRTICSHLMDGILLHSTSLISHTS